jgi:DnaJ-class molecular chaperone
MIDDDDFEPPYCSACNGTGEGQYDGANCSSCGGSGFERPDEDPDDFDIPIDWDA